MFCNLQGNVGQLCEWMGGWSSQQCSCEQSGCEGSSTAAFHFTGSEDSGSVHSFNTYLPWAGVCVRKCVRESKHGFIWLVILIQMDVVHSRVCMCVCLCVTPHLHGSDCLCIDYILYLFCIFRDACVCLSVYGIISVSVIVQNKVWSEMLGGCFCSYHNGRWSWGRKKRERGRKKTEQHYTCQKTHPSCLLFSSLKKVCCKAFAIFLCGQCRTAPCQESQSAIDWNVWVLLHAGSCGNQESLCNNLLQLTSDAWILYNHSSPCSPLPSCTVLTTHSAPPPVWS